MSPAPAAPEGRARWRALGSVAPGALTEARLEAHWAAQVAAAVGSSVAAPEPDYGHLSLQWSEGAGAFFGPLVGGAGSPAAYRAGIAPGELTLLVADGTGAVFARLALRGKTLAESMGFVADAVAAHTGAPRPDLRRPEHEMPHHPVGDGAPFTFADPDAFAELGRWFGDAVGLLEELRAADAASPVRLWPHHFDVATLEVLDPELPSEEARSVGVGLSPGDGTYAEPYLYVLPWPPPALADPPPLAGGGRWHTAGWTGAVLKGSDLVGEESQEAAARAFLRSAVAAARRLIA